MANETWLAGRWSATGRNNRGDTRSTTARRRTALPVNLVEPAVLAADVAVVVGASVLAGLTYSWSFFGNAGDLQFFFGLGVLVAVYCSSFLAARGCYRIKNLIQFRRQLKEIAAVWLSVFFILMSVAFALKIGEAFSRGSTLTFFAAGFVGLLLWRGYLASYLADLLAHGGFAERNVILVGERAQLSSSAVLRDLRHCGYKPVKTFAVTEGEIVTSGMAPSLRSSLNSVIETARHETVDDIFLLIGWDRSRCIENILTFLSVLPIPVHLVPDQNVARFLGYPLVHVGATWMAELRREPLTLAERAFKRTLDIALAGAAVVLFSPMMLIVACFIKLDSPGPVLFRQIRNGFNGKSFSILKFRSMRVLEDGPVIRQATRNDPRVTQFGRILRRTNLDELPQLFNVLHGEMSLVGPRPHAAAHNNEYEQRIATYAFRYHVKPGITGWAQVNGYRGETRTVAMMEKRVEHDLWYINNWSVWLDVKVLLRTLALGLQRTAY
jgi:Undecaprenyl-phosphate glucose phosphotransferase